VLARCRAGPPIMWSEESARLNDRMLAEFDLAANEPSEVQELVRLAEANVEAVHWREDEDARVRGVGERWFPLC